MIEDTYVAFRRTRPEFRATYMAAESQKVHKRQDGRVGSGTVFECFHGKGKPTMQTVLEWHPFDLMVTQDSTPVPGAVMLAQIDLSPAADGGTRIIQTMSKARGRLVPRLICNFGARLVVSREVAKGMARLRGQIEQDLEDGTIVVPEPTDVMGATIAEAAAKALSSLP